MLQFELGDYPLSFSTSLSSVSEIEKGANETFLSCPWASSTFSNEGVFNVSSRQELNQHVPHFLIWNPDLLALEPDIHGLYIGRLKISPTGTWVKLCKKEVPRSRFNKPLQPGKCRLLSERSGMRQVGERSGLLLTDKELDGGLDDRLYLPCNAEATSLREDIKRGRLPDGILPWMDQRKSPSDKAFFRVDPSLHSSGLFYLAVLRRTEEAVVIDPRERTLVPVSRQYYTAGSLISAH